MGIEEHRWSFWRIARLGCLGLLFLSVLLADGQASNEDMGPEQPIAFSHPIHVGTVSLPCEFCHSYASKSQSAGIPTVQSCVNCHQSIATEKPEIKKLLRYWDRKEPIPWVRVHSLADYVYFSHKRHVTKGIGCEQCHGDVKAMARIRQASSLKMGWCVSCHRQKAASMDCLTCHQ